MRLSSCTWIVALLLIGGLAPAALAGDQPAGASEGGVVFEPGTPALDDILERAAAREKLAFLDFRTDT